MQHDRSARTRISLPIIIRLLRLSWHQRAAFAVAMVSLAAGSGINLLFPELIRRGLNSEQISVLISHPLYTGFALIAIFAVQGVAFYVRALYFSLIGQRIVADVRSELYQRILSQPIPRFDEQRVGDLLSRLSADTTQIQDAVSIRLSVVIRYAFQALLGVVLMASLSPLLTGSLLLGLPVILGAGFFLARRLRRVSREQQQAIGVTNVIAEETFAGARLVKAFGSEEREISRYDRANAHALELGIQRSRISAFFSSFVNFLMNAFLVGVVLFGLYLTSASGLRLGDFTAFMLYAAIVAVSFAFLIGAYAEILQAVGAAERVFELIDATQDETSDATGEVVGHGPVSIRFDQVSFSYPSRPEDSVLRDVSVEFPPGKVTAIVGPSGAGKSSLANLILKFYSPSTGKILVDESDLAQIGSRSWRARIGIVPQDVLLFGVSIAENLRYGRPDASLEELRSVAAKVQMLEFIEHLPQKFETIPGERSVQLSGGQKQRLAVARALLRRPDLLILDEATSAIDSATEAAVLRAIREEAGNATVVVIAHRLSTVQHADQVIVLDRGEIVQVGTHAALARQPGLYKNLVDGQELGILG